MTPTAVNTFGGQPLSSAAAATTTATNDTSIVARHLTPPENGSFSLTAQQHGGKNMEPNASSTNFKLVLQRAKDRAIGGGLPGAVAMGAQVGGLMWLRTTMNYQYRNGTTTTVALRTLYNQGGIGRFYRGVGPALVQGPLSRFGDTAANAGVLELFEANDRLRSTPVAIKTACASAAAALWRIALMPVDTTKTIMQVEGRTGFSSLRAKVRTGGPRVLYHGAIAASGATLVGHFPWFYTHNALQEALPIAESTLGNLGRNALIGFCSSVVSDCVSNSVRVTKVVKQASTVPITYSQAIQSVVAVDGVQGLFFRGLKTRVAANGLQGMLFTVIWKGLEKRWRDQEEGKNHIEEERSKREK